MDPGSWNVQNGHRKPAGVISGQPAYETPANIISRPPSSPIQNQGAEWDVKSEGWVTTDAGDEGFLGQTSVNEEPNGISLELTLGNLMSAGRGSSSEFNWKDVMIQSREAVSRSRQKSKAYIRSLEAQLEKIVGENEKLKMELKRLKEERGRRVAARKTSGRTTHADARSSDVPDHSSED